MISNDFTQKKLINYVCEKCDFNTSNKNDYNRHLKTKKHNFNDCQLLSIKNTQKNSCECKCGKNYKDYSGLWRHKKKCNFDENSNKQPNNTENLINYLMKENTEFKQLLIDQNKQMIELSKTASNYNINNNNNCHNKTFNLNMFLNETCKNAMNITDFVDSLQLQLSDLENVGELGYIEGISSIIVKNLNALDVTERPIHCTDKKRETMYIKDEDKWEKEDEKKNKMHKMVKKIANKNINLISEFRQVYPDYKKVTSKVSDQFNKIIIESMGGSGDNDYEKEEKIIKKIAKEVFVDKTII
jgi:hypothetical protein